MSIGQLEEVFALELHGIELPAVRELAIPTKGLHARFEPGQLPRLIVQIEGSEESAARAEADRVVQELYRRLLLRFGANIEYAAQPRSIRQSFTPRATSSPSKTIVTVTHSVDAVLAARATVIPRTELEEVIRDVEIRVVTPQVPTSAQLYTAIDMYTVGLESRNNVVRYLVLYSAVALAALFKRGNGKQENVDALLVGANSALTLSQSPKRLPKKRRSNVPAPSESLYTKLRNDLIHAEERGCDPAGAMAAIEAYIGQFQRDVAQVISKL